MIPASAALAANPSKIAGRCGNYWAARRKKRVSCASTAVTGADIVFSILPGLNAGSSVVLACCELVQRHQRCIIDWLVQNSLWLRASGGQGLQCAFVQHARPLAPSNSPMATAAAKPSHGLALDNHVQVRQSTNDDRGSHRPVEESPRHCECLCGPARPHRVEPRGPRWRTGRSSRPADGHSRQRGR